MRRSPARILAIFFKKNIKALSVVLETEKLEESRFYLIIFSLEGSYESSPRVRHLPPGSQPPALVLPRVVDPVPHPSLLRH